jgi:hypothetical protein
MLTVKHRTRVTWINCIAFCSTCLCCTVTSGYRIPAKFPVEGLNIGVAERYEIVCDFSKTPSRTLYLWNDKDTARFVNVPYFCYSHLLARLEIGQPGARTAGRCGWPFSTPHHSCCQAVWVACRPPVA